MGSLWEIPTESESEDAQSPCHDALGPAKRGRPRGLPGNPAQRRLLRAQQQQGHPPAQQQQQQHHQRHPQTISEYIRPLGGGLLAQLASCAKTAAETKASDATLNRILDRCVAAQPRKLMSLSSEAEILETDTKNMATYLVRSAALLCFF